MGCTITPAWAAGPPPSAMTGWEKRSSTSWSPGRVCSRMPIWLHMVPLGRNRAASCPRSSATRSWRALTVGSRLRCSSPTSASAMAFRIPGVGRVWVSLWRLTTSGPELTTELRHAQDRLGGVLPLVALSPARPGQGLVHGLRGDDPEGAGHPGVELDPGDAPGGLGADVVV